MAIPTNAKIKCAEGKECRTVTIKFVIHAEVRSLKLIKVISKNTPLILKTVLFFSYPFDSNIFLMCRNTLFTSSRSDTRANATYLE